MNILQNNSHKFRSIMNDVQFNEYTHLLNHDILHKTINKSIIIAIISKFVVYDLKPTPTEHQNHKFPMEKLFWSMCLLSNL